MAEKDLTTISITKDARTRLKSYGIKGETYTTIVNNVLNELDMDRKENEMLSEVREWVFGPIKHIMINSTEDEIDQFEICGGYNQEFEKRLKTFWKRFAKKEGKTIIERARDENKDIE